MTGQSRDNRIDVICQHDREGEVIPMRIRLTDEDNVTQVYNVLGYRRLSQDRPYTMPNGFTVDEACGMIAYAVHIRVFGMQKTVKLMYNKQQCIWRIMGV